MHCFMLWTGHSNVFIMLVQAHVMAVVDLARLPISAFALHLMGKLSKPAVLVFTVTCYC